MEKLSVSIAEGSAITGLPRSTLLALIAKGEIASAKVGKRRLIFMDSLGEFLKSKAE